MAGFSSMLRYVSQRVHYWTHCSHARYAASNGKGLTEQRPNTRLSAICSRTRHGKPTKIIGIQLIVLWQRFWSAQTNGARIYGGQSATVRRSACILHSLFTRAADSRSALPRGSNFSTRSSGGLEQDHGADELFSRSKRCAGSAKHRAKGIAAR